MRGGRDRPNAATIRSDAPFRTVGPCSKSGCEIDEAPEADNAGDGVDIAERHLGDREQVDSALPCGEDAVFECDISAEFPYRKSGRHPECSRSVR